MARFDLTNEIARRCRDLSPGMRGALRDGIATRSSSRPPGESELTLPQLAYRHPQPSARTSATRRRSSRAEQTKDWTCGYECLAALIRTLAPDAAALDLKPRASASCGRPRRPPASTRRLRRSTPTSRIGAIDMATVLLHLRCDAHIIELIEPVGVGAAVYAAARTLFASGYTRAPIVLQGATRARTILGVTTSPPRVVLRDSRTKPGCSAAWSCRPRRPAVPARRRAARPPVREASAGAAQCDDARDGAVEGKLGLR